MTSASSTSSAASGHPHAGRLRRMLPWSYVLLVAALAASAFWRPAEGFSLMEVAALVLTLPTLIAALPVIYVAGAGAWHLTGADSGGPMWPVTAVYATVFAAAAVVNVRVLRFLLMRLRRRRSPDVPQ
jgi:hypothetical protein